MKWLFLLILLGCIHDATALDERDIEAIERFQLVNSDGIAAPPVSADRLNGEWPYGVLLLVKGGMVKRASSISHFGEGVLLTAAHNLKHDSNAGSYAVIFYDSAGKKSWAPLTSLGYVPPSDVPAARDLAVLKANESKTANWHSIQGSVMRYSPEEVTSTRPRPQQVDVFAADPLVVRPDVFNKMRLQLGNIPQGMVLSKRSAIATRVRPVPSLRFFDRGRQEGPRAAYIDTVEPQGTGRFWSGNSGGVVVCYDPRHRPQVVGTISDIALSEGLDVLGNTGTHSNEVAFASASVLEDVLLENVDFLSTTQSCALALQRLGLFGSE